MDKQSLIKEVFQQYQDPEIGVDVWTLGLIYNVTINENSVHVLMTFTSPMCPYGPHMVEDLKNLIKSKGIKDVTIEITFEPPWQPSDEVREMLGV